MTCRSYPGQSPGRSGGPGLSKTQWPCLLPFRHPGQIPSGLLTSVRCGWVGFKLKLELSPKWPQGGLSHPMATRPLPLGIHPCALLLPVRRFMNCASQQIAAILQGQRTRTNCGCAGEPEHYCNVAPDMNMSCVCPRLPVFTTSFAGHGYARPKGVYGYVHRAGWCRQRGGETDVFSPRLCGITFAIHMSLGGGGVRGHQRAQAKFKEPPSIVPRATRVPKHSPDKAGYRSTRRQTRPAAGRHPTTLTGQWTP